MTPHLLDLDPDDIFKKEPIHKIDEILQKVNAEIERRRVELRTLVGERYRDLIDAADKINEMTVLSKNAIGDIEVLNKSISGVKEMPEPVVNTIKEKKSSMDDKVAAQLKLLFDLPEIAWTSIEENNLIKAAELYLFTRHVKTGFSVDASLKDAKYCVPMLEQQWSMMADFPSLIMKGVEEHLTQRELDIGVCCRSLVSARLLESRCLVSRLLQARLDCIENQLNSQQDVTTSFVQSHRALKDTLSAVQYFFIDECQSIRGNVWYRLTQFSNKLHKPVIEYLDPAVYHVHLPSIVTNFRASPPTKVEHMSVEEVNQKITEWLEKVKQIISTQGKILLKSVTSLRVIKDFDTSNLDGDKYWEDFYWPLIAARVEQLISLHWSQLFTDLCSRVKETFSEPDREKAECDLRWYIWKENAHDINFVDVDVKSKTKGLWLKARGVTPRVRSLCDWLEDELSSLNSDLQEVFGGHVHHASFKEHHQKACSEMLLRLRDFIKDVVSNKNVDETTLLMLGRFLQSVPDLCPTLQKCLTNLNEANVTAKWLEAKTLLNTESIYVWSIWESAAASQMEGKIKSMIRKPETYADLLNNIPQWDIKCIEEGDKKSQVRVPLCPSLHVQSIFQYIALQTTRRYLPKLVSDNLMQKLLPVILDCLQDQFICQSEALQTLLDIKYLSHFVSPSNKEVNTACLAKLKEVESHVDPFDLDTFLPLINANTKMSISRTQLLVGGSGVLSETQAGFKQGEEASLVALSKGSANVWFPPLPVTNPTARGPHLKKPKASKMVNSLRERTDLSKQIPNVASSFFNEWFS